MSGTEGERETGRPDVRRTSTPSEESLSGMRTTLVLERARGGDSRARDEIVLRLMPKIQRFVEKECGARVRERFSTSDLIQEAVCKALEYIPRIEGDRSTLDAYVYRIAQNVVRSAGRVVPLLARVEAANPCPEHSTVRLDPVDEDATTPSMATARNEERACLRAAIALLDPDDQEILVAIRLNGEPIEVVAERMGKSYDAVRVHSYRAHTHLVAAIRRMKAGQLPLPVGTGDEDP